MEKYCTKCASKCDEITGLCPKCDRAQLEAFREILAQSETEKEDIEVSEPVAAIESDEIDEIQYKNVSSDYSENEEYDEVDDVADEVKRNGILAVIASFIAIILIVTVIMLGVSKGWIGGKAKRAQLKSAYSAYLNNKSVPEHGMYDLSHPKQSVDGIVAAKQLDLNSDNNDEFIIAYYDKTTDSIDFKLSCYEYNSKSLIQGRSTESDGTEGVELNATVTAFSVPDYTSKITDTEREQGEVSVYTVESKNNSYIAVEHLSFDEGCVYEMHVFTVDGGVFREVGNLYSDDISNDGSIIVSSSLLPSDIKIDNNGFNASSLDFWEYIEESYKDRSILYMSSGDGSFKYDNYYSSADAAVEDFSSAFGMKKKQYISRENENSSQFALILPKEDSMVLRNLYYVKNAGLEDEEEVCEAKDYTDYLSLLYADNLRIYNEAADKNQETADAEKEQAAKQKISGDIQFGDIVRISSDTYYWKYNGSSFASKGAEAGEYDYRISSENELICRDVNGEEKTVLEANGAGALAIAGGKIYYQRVSSGYNNYRIYSCYLDGSYPSYVGEGMLCGVVQNGTYVIYSATGDSRKFDNIYSIKTDDTEKSTVAYDARFLFISDDRIYYQAQEESSEDARKGMTTLCSVNGNGSGNRAVFYTQSDLYDESDYDATRTLIINPYVFNDYVYYAYGSYKDSGEYRGGALVKCALDGSDGEVVGTSKTDTFTLDTKGNVYSADDEKYVNGYSFSNGEMSEYDPQSDTVNVLIKKSDYEPFSQLLLGEKGNDILTLRFAEKVGDKLYFALCEGESDSDGLYTYKSFALFEKDTKAGNTTLIYSTNKTESEE